MGQTSVLEWLGATYILGNTLLAYLYAVLAFAASLAVIHLIKTLGLGKLRELAKKTDTDLDDLALALLEKFQWFEYQLVALYVATRYVARGHAFDRTLNTVILLVFTYRAITLAQHLLSYWLHKVVSSRDLSGEARDSVVNGTQVILRSLVWVLAALFVLDNLGINISTVLAGLGIGGVAVALAAQTILGDLFNFFVILLDKPFKTGDFVVCDDIQGTIEHVGIKSTRVRSMAGELVVVSNSKLLASGLHNFNQMPERRVAFTLNVSHQTPMEKLRRIPGLLKSAVSAAKNARFDRASLTAYSELAVQFETVYYVTSGDFNLYIALHEEILLRIGDAFKAEAIEFAWFTTPVLRK
ncbi:MAG: hypothetical protein A2016_09800 [Elusimicrobia bacterium GWF2_62_30]|nr:MAG: hypothetical protein A2016_09800 [Elusimicrobia bacterium GWF2_62_30]